MNHSPEDIKIAKERVILKRALRSKHIPFHNNMKTSNLLRLCNLFGIEI